MISVAEMLCFASDAAMAIRALCLFLASPGGLSVWGTRLGAVLHSGVEF